MSATRTYAINHAINAGSMTGTSVLTSTAMPTKVGTQVGIQATWTGAAVGTFAFQVSNDGGANWATITLDKTLTNPNNNAGTTAGQLSVCPYEQVRLIYTNSSSTGTLDVWISVKGE